MAQDYRTHGLRLQSTEVYMVQDKPRIWTTSGRGAQAGGWGRCDTDIFVLIH